LSSRAGRPFRETAPRVSSSRTCRRETSRRVARTRSSRSPAIALATSRARSGRPDSGVSADWTEPAAPGDSPSGDLRDIPAVYSGSRQRGATAVPAGRQARIPRCNLPRDGLRQEPHYRMRAGGTPARHDPHWHAPDDNPDYGPAARIRPCVNSPSQVHKAAGTSRSRWPSAILDLAPQIWIPPLNSEV